MSERIIYDRKREMEQDDYVEWFKVLVSTFGAKAVSEALESLPKPTEPDPIRCANEPEPGEWKPLSLREVLDDDWLKNYGQGE